MNAMRLLSSVVPILLSTACLVGWALGINELRTDLIAQQPMSVLAGSSMLALGIVVALWPRGRHARLIANLFACLCAMVIAGAIVSLSQTAIAISSGYADWAWLSELRLPSWPVMNLSPSTAMTLLMLGPAIILLLSATAHANQTKTHEITLRRMIISAQVFALMAFVLTLFVLTGYLYHSVSLISIAALTPMPRVTALGLMLLSLSVLTIAPNRGLMRFITHDGPSGQMARFLVPVSIFVPIGLGWLRIIGMQSHLYDSEYGIDLSTMLNVVMLGTLTLVSARKLYKSDQKARIVEQELLYRATHDSLTGLVNRPVFREQLTKRLRLAARRPGNPFAVFYLDLDGFKQGNDVLGHDAGDRMLVQIADMLRATTRGSDTVARFGGDEFVVLFEEIDNRIAAEQLAGRILQAMPSHFGNGKLSVPIGISIGIAITETGDLTPDEILRDADTAMYLAKEKGKGCYQLAGAA